MKVSMRTDYGVRAAIELADRFGRPPVPSAEIAAAQDIPEPYLDQLLVALRKGGIIRSARGPQGGHALANAPRDTSLADVVAALEGRCQPVACLDGSGRCNAVDACAQAEIWQEIDSATWAILDRVTLADLVARQDTLAARVMYHI